MPPANPTLPYSRGRGQLQLERERCWSHPLVILILQVLYVCGLGLLILKQPIFNDLAQRFFYLLLIPVIFGFACQVVLIIFPNSTKVGCEDNTIVILMTASYAWFYAIIASSYEMKAVTHSMILATCLVAFVFAVGYWLPFDITSWHGSFQMYVGIFYAAFSILLLLVTMLTKERNYGLAFSILTLVIYSFVSIEVWFIVIHRYGIRIGTFFNNSFSIPTIPSRILRNGFN